MRKVTGVIGLLGLLGLLEFIGLFELLGFIGLFGLLGLRVEIFDKTRVHLRYNFSLIVNLLKIIL